MGSLSSILKWKKYVYRIAAVAIIAKIARLAYLDICYSVVLKV